MTFRLTNLFYLFALVAAALAAFGAADGLVVTIGILFFWEGLFYLPRPGCVSLFVFGIAFLLLFMVFMACNFPDDDPKWNYTACKSNMQDLTTAIIDFESTSGTLPGKSRSLDATPPQSWRVASAKDLEHECPSNSRPSDTNYFAITGPKTVWGDGEPRSFEDVSDGLGNTILLIEAGDRGIYWAEPRDLSFDQAVELLTTPLPANGRGGHRLEYGYFYKPSYLRNVSMCDGSVRSLRVPLPREAAVALLTANGGEQIDPQWTEFYPPAELDYGRVWGFSLFVVLALLPGMPKVRPWIWPQSATDSALRTPNSALDQ